jgi:hypothetical protein
MSKYLLCLLLFSATFAASDNINQILTVDLSISDCANNNTCAADPGVLGGPPTSGATFSPIGEP